VNLLGARLESGLELFVLRPDVVVGVSPFVHVADAADSGLDDFFGAAETGAHGGVDDAAFDSDSEPGGLE